MQEQELDRIDAVSAEICAILDREFPTPIDAIGYLEALKLSIYIGQMMPNALANEGNVNYPEELGGLQ
jgi:hypothetical protein